MVCINNICYEVLKDEREAFNEEAFRGRFIDVLSRYDYIVGDWGYNQLRLRGFLMIVTRRQRMIRRLVRFKIIYMNIVILAVRILS